jgi:DNA-binding protein HU-beta
MLYDKLMKVFYLLSIVFMLLFLAILAIGVVNGSVNCKLPDATSTFCIDNQALIYQYSLGLFLILMIVFLIGGRIFYELINHESDLISVAEYRKSLALQQKRLDENAISKEQLYKRLKAGRTKKYEEPTFFKRVHENAKQMWCGVTKVKKLVSTKCNNLYQAIQTYFINRKKEREIAHVKEIEHLHQESIEEHAHRSKGRMNKLELILIAAHSSQLPETTVRSVLNAFIQVVNQNIKNESIQIEGFGTFDLIEDEKGLDVEFYPNQELFSAVTVVLEQKEDIDEVLITKQEKQEIKEQTTSTMQEASPKEEKADEVKNVLQTSEAKEISNKVVETDKIIIKKITNTLTKTALIELMEQSTNLSKNKANKFLNALTVVLTEALKQRKQIDFQPIGYFKTIEMPAKDAVNPQTKKAIVVPAHYQVRFRFNPEFKDMINQPKKAE